MSSSRHLLLPRDLKLNYSDEDVALAQSCLSIEQNQILADTILEMYARKQRVTNAHIFAMCAAMIGVECIVQTRKNIVKYVKKSTKIANTFNIKK